MNDINKRICQAVENHPSKIALIGQGTSLTYLKMNEYIKKIMQEIDLFCCGKVQGKLVYIYMHSSLEAIISQFAVIRSGAICVPLDRQTPLEYYTLNNIENVACVLTDDFKAEENIGFPIFQIKMLSDMVFEKTTYTINNHSDFVAQHSHCILTSGTTGKPKAILLK